MVNIYTSTERGMTLIELLVVMAILSLILGGIYGLLNSAHNMYLKTRALAESQQTTRVVMNYLTYRLREIDGGGSGNLGRDPRRCFDCHVPELDHDTSTDDPNIICEKDVLIPRRNLFLENLTTLPASELPALSGVDSKYTDLGHNSITFWADLLPTHGVSDTFADSRESSGGRNGEWDLKYDNNADGTFDRDDNDREFLYLDYNDNGLFEYYGEKWTLKLRKPGGKNYYELVETLTFENFTSKNNSVYSHDSSGTAYSDAPIAYGVTGLGIAIIPNYTSQGDFGVKMGTNGVQERKMGNHKSCVDGCHDGSGTGSGDYGTTAANGFKFTNFVAVHPWWDTKGLSIELATTDPRGKKFIKTKQFVIPRNLEINKR